ncbi:MAG: cytochrome c, partial [Beijerinckiaceae bacterium]|nr:cytochrome c [Beijerinckiaceae bacterium]
MIRGMIVATALVFCAGLAQADDIGDRQAAMKAMGKALKPVAGMVKGEVKFDAAVVKASMKSIADNATKSLKLYAPGTSKGKTAALPAVWEKKADFDAIFKSLAAASTAAGAQVSNLASLKAIFGGVAKICGACHTD